MRTILLKLSGEALSGDRGFGFDEAVCLDLSRQIKVLSDRGVRIAIVTGGGNYWRGRNSSKIIERTHSDSIGMMGTIMNCIYMSEILRTQGMKTEVFTPFICGGFTKQFSRDEALKCLDEGKVIFCAGGTGHPYFSTDSGTALMALQLSVDCILLGKSIDGIYSGDPKTDPTAVKYDRLPYSEIIEKHLNAVDISMAIMCNDNKVPMKVFGLDEEDAIIKAFDDDAYGTVVYA
ncbi:MAG: UMP kinase [Lachnospiraceae bacterium]|nr:UMP kinase [Lachnospiraceae bacterium]